MDLSVYAIIMNCKLNLSNDRITKCRHSPMSFQPISKQGAERSETPISRRASPLHNNKQDKLRIVELLIDKALETSNYDPLIKLIEEQHIDGPITVRELEHCRTKIRNELNRMNRALSPMFGEYAERAVKKIIRLGKILKLLELPSKTYGPAYGIWMLRALYFCEIKSAIKVKDNSLSKDLMSTMKAYEKIKLKVLKFVKHI